MPKSKQYPRELITISDHIRKRRLDLKLSQAAVARTLNVVEDTLIYWENHRSEPLISLMPKIIEFLGYIPYSFDTGTLGGRVKEYRYVHGISKKNLAKMLQVDPSTITAWEDNQFIPGHSNYKRLMDLLECV